MLYRIIAKTYLALTLAFCSFFVGAAVGMWAHEEILKADRQSRRSKN